MGKNNCEKRIGEISKTNSGYSIKIIEYIDSGNVIVEFLDSGLIVKTTYGLFKKGVLKYPLTRSIIGVGYIGVGNYSHATHKKPYVVWASMLCRCYSLNYHKKQPTYKDCSVVEEWHNFQVFAKWYEENWEPWMNNFWELDKDILIKGNKVYSPETCCFLPKEVNLLFGKNNIKRGILPIGVHAHKNKFRAKLIKNNKSKHLGLFGTSEEAFQAYKVAKEECIKEVVDKWKDLVDLRVYEAMCNYKVEITD